MKYNKIIGIDPGKSGGIAIYYKKQTKAGKMPEDVGAFARMIEAHKQEGELIVFLERVSMFMSDSDKKNNGKQFRIQKMLANYESMITTLKIFGVPYVEVTPMVWQKHLNLWIKGAEKIVRKQKYKAAAQSWHPEIKVINATADALCVLRFARRKMVEDPKWIEEKVNIQKEEDLPF